MNGNFVHRLYGDKFCVGLALLRALRQLGHSALTFSTLVEKRVRSCRTSVYLSQRKRSSLLGIV
jgi:UDP-2,3-diacylglucosamine pyrophosphatase LpxH